MLKGNKIALVLGLIGLAAGIFVFRSELTLRKKAVQTKGIVVSTLGSTFDVQYVVVDGTEKVKRFSTKSNHNRAGDPKNVWYLPENPERAKLTNDTKGGRTLLQFAIVCLLLGVYPLFMKKKETA